MSFVLLQLIKTFYISNKKTVKLCDLKTMNLKKKCFDKTFQKLIKIITRISTSVCTHFKTDFIYTL